MSEFKMSEDKLSEVKISEVIMSDIQQIYDYVSHLLMFQLRQDWPDFILQDIDL